MLCLIIEISDLKDMEDLVDDFVTFYVAGNIHAVHVYINPLILH